jgi:hypothetical protein
MLHLSRFVDVWPHKPFGKAIVLRSVCNAASIFVVAIVSNGWFGGLQDSKLNLDEAAHLRDGALLLQVSRDAPGKPAQLPNEQRVKYSSTATTTAAHTTPRRSSLSLRLTAGNAGHAVGEPRGTAYVGPTTAANFSKSWSASFLGRSVAGLDGIRSVTVFPRRERKSEASRRSSFLAALKHRIRNEYPDSLADAIECHGRPVSRVRGSAR